MSDAQPLSRPLNRIRVAPCPLTLDSRHSTTSPCLSLPTDGLFVSNPARTCTPSSDSFSTVYCILATSATASAPSFANPLLPALPHARSTWVKCSGSVPSCTSTGSLAPFCTGAPETASLPSDGDDARSTVPSPRSAITYSVSPTANLNAACASGRGSGCGSLRGAARCPRRRLLLSCDSSSFSGASSYSTDPARAWYW